MSRGLSWIDFWLGVRMLVRYPGLTLIAGLGMAVSIAITAVAFTLGSTLFDASVPMEDGDRLMAIQNRDVQTNNREDRSMASRECAQRHCRGSRVSRRNSASVAA